MYSKVDTSTYGKWILAGEHAVLRGQPALVFPLSQKTLRLIYEPSNQSFSSDYEGDSGESMHVLFLYVLEQGLQQLNHSLAELTGHFYLHSTLPIGVGMGASAALCVAVTRWFDAQHMLTNTSVNAFATQLEHLFHGKSSGVDIAGVSANTGIYFKQGRRTPIVLQWQPQWYLSSSGTPGTTLQCIQQVNNIWDKAPIEAHAIDVQMGVAVEKSLLSLTGSLSPTQQMLQLQQAIQVGCACFESWGLVNAELSQHMQMLYSHGAIAVKPTGSGGGGYVLSLWDKPPPPCTEFITL